METTMEQCRHTTGFGDVRPARPGLYEGVCKDCDEPRYIDQRGNVYETLVDADHGRVERRMLT